MRKTVATAEQTYVDPSALSRLYFHHEEGSREMAAWRKKTRGSLPVTHHGHTEVVNAIGLAVFRGSLAPEDASDSWKWLEDDFVSGHLLKADILWRGALNRAADLSREHTPALGSRSLDVVHVACALELHLRAFLTFDHRRQELAAATGMKVIRLIST
ncbi:MAG TPA: type II toxin-antitoxin system VapC family toxin [Verrucomicrobiae bacterium]|nr:type II toxin-antitoxin system VapC family toxin [Verrucomicrobiae bacterium]